MKNNILLTFDDSPSVNFGELIEFLEFNKIPAIFFCKGDLLVEQREEAKRAISKGLTIANHAWNHNYFSSLSLTESLEEVRRTDTLICEIYKDCKIPDFPKFFRFPYGDRGDLRYGRPSIFHLFRSDRKSLLQFFKATLMSMTDPFKVRRKKKSQKINELLKTLRYSNVESDKRLDMSWTLDCGEWRYRDSFRTTSLDEIVDEIWLNFNSTIKRNKKRNHVNS